MIVYVVILITATYAAAVGEFPDPVSCQNAAIMMKVAISAPPVTIINPVLMCVPKVLVPPLGDAHAPARLPRYPI